LHTLQHAHEQTPVTPLPSGLPAALNDLVQRCLAKTPAARYPTLAALRAGLTNLYQAHFDHAPPPRLTPDAFTAGDYNNWGVTYAALQEHAAALADYTTAIQIDPNDATAYSNRGVTYADLQDYERALADYTQAIQINPTDAQAYNNRGNTYADLQDNAAALADFTHAIHLDPTDAQAYLNLGVLLYHQGGFADAVAYFERAAQLGDPQGAPYAAQARQMLGMEPAPSQDPALDAFDAFQQADSVAAMRQAVARFPLLVQPDFITAIEQVIAQQVPLAERPAFTQRLTWLRQIASTQRSNP